jgi:Ca2+/Na+ antiporter
LIPCLLNGLKIHRWEGMILLAAYLAFVAWQVRTAGK